MRAHARARRTDQKEEPVAAGRRWQEAGTLVYTKRTHHDEHDTTYTPRTHARTHARTHTHTHSRHSASRRQARPARGVVRIRQAHRPERRVDSLSQAERQEPCRPQRRSRPRRRRTPTTSLPLGRHLGCGQGRSRAGRHEPLSIPIKVAIGGQDDGKVGGGRGRRIVILHLCVTAGVGVRAPARPHRSYWLGQVVADGPDGNAAVTPTCRHAHTS